MNDTAIYMRWIQYMHAWSTRRKLFIPSVNLEYWNSTFQSKNNINAFIFLQKKKYIKGFIVYIELCFFILIIYLADM
jgi:hypothetical protein